VSICASRRLEEKTRKEIALYAESLAILREIVNPHLLIKRDASPVESLDIRPKNVQINHVAVVVVVVVVVEDVLVAVLTVVMVEEIMVALLETIMVTPLLIILVMVTVNDPHQGEMTIRTTAAVHHLQIDILHLGLVMAPLHLMMIITRGKDLMTLFRVVLEVVLVDHRLPMAMVIVMAVMAIIQRLDLAPDLVLGLLAILTVLVLLEDLAIGLLVVALLEVHLDMVEDVALCLQFQEGALLVVEVLLAAREVLLESHMVVPLEVILHK